MFAGILLRRLVLLFGLWLVLTANESSAWPVGILASAIATIISLRLLPPQAQTVRLGIAFRLLPGFVWDSFLGGLDVASRAVHPRLPVHPAWIIHRSRLPSGVPRLALGNVLSLMPGTLAAGSYGDSLLIHCLDRKQPIKDHVDREEARIARSIGIALDKLDG